jgi:DNA segregation ATPase FtsK/SpoIIIE-like protein
MPPRIRSRTWPKNIAYEEYDPLFEQAAEVVREHKRGSPSLMQRELKVGYMKSALLIEQLEAAGVVSPRDPVTHGQRVVCTG